MGFLIIPNSNGEDSAPLHEFNQCHSPGGSPAGGQFCATGAPGGPPRIGGGVKARHTPVKVKTVEQALDLIRRGIVVEVEDVRTVHTLITKLAEMALDAKAKGAKAPDYDLCKVTVAGSKNLFCVGRLRTQDYPEGRKRIEMPQLSAEPIPGSDADKLPRMRTQSGSMKTVDASEAYVAHLQRQGIKVGDVEEVPAELLKASQRELVGTNVAQMMTDRTFDPARDPIFISRDGYVLDGHHRWAAVVGRDAEDGHLGDSKMRVRRIDALMSEILLDATEWTTKFGLKAKAGKVKEALVYQWM